MLGWQRFSQTCLSLAVHLLGYKQQKDLQFTGGTTLKKLLGGND